VDVFFYILLPAYVICILFGTIARSDLYTVGDSPCISICICCCCHICCFFVVLAVGVSVWC
jgi:hypothetical protein